MELDKAIDYLNVAKGIGTGPEIDIADAFITSQKGDKNAALKALAGIDSPSSRSAALMIVVHHEGPEGAIDWLETVEFSASDLDADGKYFLFTLQLELAYWEAARETLNAISDQDINETHMD